MGDFWLTLAIASMTSRECGESETCQSHLARHVCNAELDAFAMQIMIDGVLKMSSGRIGWTWDFHTMSGGKQLTAEPRAKDVEGHILADQNSYRSRPSASDATDCRLR